MVFSKWIQQCLSESGAEVSDDLVNENNFAEAFHDGTLLLQLAECLTKQSSGIKPQSKQLQGNKLAIVGYINNVLKFIENQNMKLTLSGDNIYDQDETLILGLIWTLILKYQVGKKTEIMLWLRNLLEPETVSNFDANWRDGTLFCKLVNILLESEEPIPDGVIPRLSYAFETADNKLGIRQLLTAEHIADGYFDETICLTYLSFFYNKFKKVEKKEPPPPAEDPRIKELEELVEELRKDITGKEKEVEELQHVSVEKDKIIKKSGDEIKKIMGETKTLEKELEEQKAENEENCRAITELQLKLPFLNQKVENEIPAPSGANTTLALIGVENANDLWNDEPNDMAAALGLMQATARRIAKVGKGYEGAIENETMTFAFDNSPAALTFVHELQVELNQLEWPERFVQGRQEFFKGLPIVMGVHTGPCAFLEGKYTGPAFRVCKRLLSAARPGEILTSGETWNAQDEESSEIVEQFANTELGQFEVQETGTSVDVIQLFPNSLEERKSLYKEFEFLTPQEKKQVEMAEKLEKLQLANDTLKEKLGMTEAQAKKARDRALELNKWFQESQKNLRTTVGNQIQAAMEEVSTILKESKRLEGELRKATKQLDGARRVMNTMDGRLKQLGQQNTILNSEVSGLQVQQLKLITTIEQLEEELASRKKGILNKLGIGRKSHAHDKKPKHAAAVPAAVVPAEGPQEPEDIPTRPNVTSKKLKHSRTKTK